MYNATDTAEKINDCLKKKGLSQKDMLEEVGLNKNTISSMLSRGSMLRADNLAKIADYLNCSVDFLLNRNITDNDKETVLIIKNSSEYVFLQTFLKLSAREQKEILAIISYKLEQKGEISSPSNTETDHYENLA